MIRMFGLPEIKSVLHIPDLLKVIEEGFVLFSGGKVVVPPVGHMGFQDPPGDVHIKYGYIMGESRYVIKIASSFYHNPQYNLSSSNGMMLVFNQKTGEPEAILADEGYLTDIRTAAAGAVVARYLAPRNVRCIGIVGAGGAGAASTSVVKRGCRMQGGSCVGKGPGKIDRVSGGNDGFWLHHLHHDKHE